jgi:hypothetical protein
MVATWCMTSSAPVILKHFSHISVSSDIRAQYTFITLTSKLHTHLLWSSNLHARYQTSKLSGLESENHNVWIQHFDAYMSKQYSTCTSLQCKLYFLTLAGRQPQVHSGTILNIHWFAIFWEVMPRRETTACQHFSATACLHHLPWLRRQ